MIDFSALASSSDGCCYRVGCGSQPPLLIDAGLSFAAIQRALNFRISTLAGVLISHAHGDHAKAIKPLMAAGVDVYASLETWEILGIQSHRAHAIEPREEFTIADTWRVIGFEAVHDVPGTLGFMIAGPEGGRLLYLTDTAYSKFRFEGLTHIAIEANFSTEKIRQNTLAGIIDRGRHRRTSFNHMSIERLEEFFRTMKADGLLADVEEIHLMHLSDMNSDETLFVRRIQSVTGKPVYICAKKAQGASA